MVDVYRVGLHRPVDQETETDKKMGTERGRQVQKCAVVVIRSARRDTEQRPVRYC